MKIMRPTYAVILILIFSALYASISNTWKWASSFNGLVVLVSVPDDHRSYNPFSKDFFWVSQNMALSIIKEREYPFKKCTPISDMLGGCKQPKIEFTGRFIGMVDVDTEKKIFEIIDFLIKRKEPINSYSSEGYTALQSAILNNEPKLVSVLLQAGADPNLPIKSEGRLKGKNSFEFLEILLIKDKKEFSKLNKSFYEGVSKKNH